MASSTHSLLSHLRVINSNNLHTMLASPLPELSGSLGDLGTLLPLMTALTLSGSISLPSTLIFTGLSNVLTGLAFGLPLPVQPMKAIAAVAIARNFTMEQTAASGILMGAMVGVMSVTGLIGWVGKRVPIPVVKGIQAGAGLSLCISAGGKMLSTLNWTGPWWGDNLIVALLAAIALLLTLIFPRLPYALVLFVLGVILSLVRIHSSDYSGIPNPSLPSSQIPIVTPNGRTYLLALTTAALGQLPLTLLNSVLAVEHLSADLLPSLPTPSSPSLGISVALMNLTGPFFGAMPTCHGSGGLAGQYRFGARSGASIVFLGACKFIIGLVILLGPGPSAVIGVLDAFPKALLGIMVVAAGIELAMAGASLNSSTARDLEGKNGDGLDERAKRDRWAVMLVTMVGILVVKNDGVGFLAGMAWWAVLLLRRRIDQDGWGFSVEHNDDRRTENDEATTAEEANEQTRLLGDRDGGDLEVGGRSR